MKRLPPSQVPARRTVRRAGGRSTSGSAVVVVLILMTVAAVLVLSNGVALRRLRVELQMLEQKQRAVAAERQPTPAPPSTQKR